MVKVLKDKQGVKMPLNDEEIIELFWGRDERAIDETDYKYRKYLFSITYNILHDNFDCEECLNDAYLGVWNAIPPTKPRVLKSFLVAITRRTAIKRYHKNFKKSSIPSGMTVSLCDLEDFITDDGDISESFDAKRLGQTISEFVRSLSQRRQFIFMSRYYIAESIDSIASQLRVSRSTVNKELAAIKSALKERLESEGFII